MEYCLRKLNLITFILFFSNNKFYYSMKFNNQLENSYYNRKKLPSVKKILKISSYVALSNSFIQSRNIIEESLYSNNQQFLINNNELSFNSSRSLRNLAAKSKDNSNNRFINFQKLFLEYINFYNHEYSNIYEFINDVKPIWDYYSIGKKSNILNYFYNSLNFIENDDQFFFNINNRLCSKSSETQCINFKIFPSEICNNEISFNNFQQLQNFLTTNSNCNNNFFIMNNVNDLYVNIPQNQQLMFNYKNFLDGQNYFYLINQNINNNYVFFNISNNDQPIHINLNNKLIYFNNHYLEVPFVNCKDQSIKIVTKNNINIGVCKNNNVNHQNINFNINNNNLILLEKLNSMGLSILSGFAVINNDFRFTFNNEKFISAFLHFYFPVYFTVYEIKNNENFLYTSIELCMDTNTRTIDINKFLKNKKDLNFCYEFHSSNPYFQNIKKVLNNPQKTSYIFIDTQRSLTKKLKIYFYNDFYLLDINNLLFGQDNTKILNNYFEINDVDGVFLENNTTKNNTITNNLIGNNSNSFNNSNNIIFFKTNNIYQIEDVQFDLLLYFFNILIFIYLCPVIINNFIYLSKKKEIINFDNQDILKIKIFHQIRTYMNGYFRNIFIMPIIEMILFSVNVSNKASLLTDGGILGNNILNIILLILSCINLSTYFLYHPKSIDSNKNNYNINRHLLKHLLKIPIKREDLKQTETFPSEIPDVNQITKYYMFLDFYIKKKNFKDNIDDIIEEKLKFLLSEYYSCINKTTISEIKQNTILYSILVVIFYKQFLINNQPLINSSIIYHENESLITMFFQNFEKEIKLIKINDKVQIVNNSDSLENIDLKNQDIINIDNTSTTNNMDVEKFKKHLKINFLEILEQSQFQGKHVFVNEIMLFLFILINLVLSSNQYAK